MRCEHCDGEVDATFRFCPWCSRALRLKLVEHFRAHPLIEKAPAGLRVSRYLSSTHHVRFSVWDASGVVAAISLEECEARRLAAFLSTSDQPRRRRRSLTRRPRSERLPIMEDAVEGDSVARVDG